MAGQTASSKWSLTKHLHKRLFMQLIFFIIISVVLFSVVIIDAFTSHLDIWWILLGALAGIVVGYLVSKAIKLRWHEDSQKVIKNIDRTGFIIIILYVLFRALANSEANKLLNGVELLAVTYSFLGGVLVGRLFSMGRRIVAIFREQKII